MGNFAVLYKPPHAPWGVYEFASRKAAEENVEVCRGHGYEAVALDLEVLGRQFLPEVMGAPTDLPSLSRYLEKNPRVTITSPLEPTPVTVRFYGHNMSTGAFQFDIEGEVGRTRALGNYLFEGASYDPDGVTIRYGPTTWRLSYVKGDSNSR